MRRITLALIAATVTSPFLLLSSSPSGAQSSESVPHFLSDTISHAKLPAGWGEDRDAGLPFGGCVLNSFGVVRKQRRSEGDLVAFPAKSAGDATAVLSEGVMVPAISPKIAFHDIDTAFSQCRAARIRVGGFPTRSGTLAPMKLPPFAQASAGFSAAIYPPTGQTQPQGLGIVIVRKGGYIIQLLYYATAAEVTANTLEPFVSLALSKIP
jgi:hypothetical protein